MKMLSSIVLQGVTELLKNYKQDAGVIAKISQLPLEALLSNDVRILGKCYSEFLENSARACNERYFGLKLAQQHGLQILGPMWLLMRKSKNVGDALKNLAEHFLLHTDCAAIILEKEFNGISFYYDVLDDTVVNETQGIEYAFTLFCIELKALIGNHWKPTFAQFRYAAPTNLEPLKKMFGDNISFNQTRYSFHINQKDLELPILSSDAEFRHLIKNQLKPRIVNTSNSLSMQVEIAIRAIISEQRCTLKDIAVTMGFNARTLQRHLDAERLSFKILHDKIRLAEAKKYLIHSNLSVASIAELLHFSETAAFTCFFKRTTGITPRSFIKANKIQTPVSFK